jgi:hypothetical protein
MKSSDPAISECDRRGPPGDGRHTASAFVVGALGFPVGRVAAVGVDVLPRTVVGRPEDQRLFGDAQLAHLVRDHPDPVIELDERVQVIGGELDRLLVDERDRSRIELLD